MTRTVHIPGVVSNREPAMTTTPQTMPTRDELLAWADEAQALIDSGEIPASEIRKAKATVAALRAQSAGGVREALDAQIKEDAWEFVKTGFQTFGLPDERLRTYADVIAELIQGAVNRERNATVPQGQESTPSVPAGEAMDIHAIAKEASERAGKNAGVAPELLYAPILWTLEGKS